MTGRRMVTTTARFVPSRSFSRAGAGSGSACSGAGGCVGAGAGVGSGASVVLTSVGPTYSRPSASNAIDDAVAGGAASATAHRLANATTIFG